MRIFVAIFFLATVGYGWFSWVKPVSQTQDELIVRALWHEERGETLKSYEIFKELYKSTGAKVYLFRKIGLALFSETNLPEAIDELGKWSKQNPDDLEAHRLLLSLYLTQKEFDLARDQIQVLMSKSKDPLDIEIAANGWLYIGEPKRAARLLEMLYAKVPSETIAIRRAMVASEYLGEHEWAIDFLKQKLKDSDDEVAILSQLVQIYIAAQDLDGIMETYNRLYEISPEDKYLEKLIQGFVLKEDYDGAIAFLEQRNIGDVYLYDLYRHKKLFDKAIEVAIKLYDAGKDPKWLAEQAVLIFEGAFNKDDSAMLQEVIRLFEKAFLEGVNEPLYLNYYGYTLIDKDIDIEKGMQAVRKAVFQDRDNHYYLDSLAWGFYKQNECEKAYEVMRRVIKIAGLTEPEIIEHWEIISRCYDPKQTTKSEK